MAEDSRKERKKQTRKTILDAAIHTFAEFGFDAASIGLIAERSKVKKTLIQYHFETKENLWKEAVNALWEQRQVALPSYFKGADKVDSELTLRFIFKQIIRFAFDHPEWLGIMLREAANPTSPRFNWLIESHIKEDYSEGLNFIKKAQSLGLLPQLPPLNLLHIISGALFYLVLVAPLTIKSTGKDPHNNDFLEEHVDTLLAMLQTGTGQAT